MKLFLRSSLAVLFATYFSASIGRAQPIAQMGADCGYGTGHACPHDTPEIDPAMGAGALVLIGGIAIVIRGRRKV